MVATIVPEEGHVKPAVHGTQLAGAPPPGSPGGAPPAEAPVKKQPASFLGVGASTYDGRNSEGNRFITDRSL